jgi:hypothetical protein
MSNKWQVLARNIIGEKDTAKWSSSSDIAGTPLTVIDRSPLKKLVRDAQAGAAGLLAAAGHQVAIDSVMSPLRRSRRNSGFTAAAQSAAMSASAAAAAEAAAASIEADSLQLAQKRAEEATAAIALLPHVSRRVALRAAPYMPGSVYCASQRSVPKYRFLRQHDIPPDNGVEYMRTVIKQHTKLINRLRHGGSPRSVAVQAEHEEQNSPRASPRGSTLTLHTIADFLQSVDVAPLGSNSSRESAPVSSFASLPAPLPIDSRASHGGLTGTTNGGRGDSAETIAPTAHGSVRNFKSESRGSSLLASRDEWEQLLRSGISSSQVEPCVSESSHSFTLHIPHHSVLHADTTNSSVSVSSNDAFMALKDLQVL